MAVTHSRAGGPASFGTSEGHRVGAVRRVLSMATAAFLAGALLTVSGTGPLIGPAAAAVHTGKAVAWGADIYHTTQVPTAALSGLTAVSSGAFHTLGLKSNGTVVAWGSNALGETKIPTGLSGVIAVSAGDGHSLALKSNGAIVAWGDNGRGQTTVPALPAGMKYTSISAGHQHSLALRSDGKIVGWGDNTYGEITVPLASPYHVKAVAAGHFFSMALKTDGTVAVWGVNNHGQTTVPAGLANVAAIAAGGYHALALRSNGTVVAWGYNNAGQAKVPAGLSKVGAISAGGEFSVAARTDGSIVTWGSNAQGQRSVPADAAGAMGIDAGWDYAVSLVLQSPPGVPTGVVAVPGAASATVSWTAPTLDGRSPITGYTVKSAPGGKTCATTTEVSCIVTGLTNGTAYTFTVTAKNVVGASAASHASAAVTPLASLLATPTPAPTPTPTPTPKPTPTATPSPTPVPSATGGPTPTPVPGGGSTDSGGGDSTPLIVLGLTGAAVLVVAVLFGLMAARRKPGDPMGPGSPNYVPPTEPAPWERPQDR